MPQVLFRRCGRHGAILRRRECAGRAAAVPSKDAFIANALELVPLTVAPIEKLKGEQQNAVDQLSTAQMPTRADESFRFTNLSKLLENRLQPPSAASHTSAPASIPQLSDDATRLVFANGQVDPEASCLEALPDSMYVGSLSGAPAEAQAALGRLSSERGGVFTWMNAATAADVQVCYLPAGVECTVPLHVVFASSSASEAGHAVMYSPRLLIVAEKDAKVEVVEEFVGEAGEGNYFMNSVTEIVLDQNASVAHRLVQTEAEGAFHIKSTFVQQEQSSSYELVEARLGGQLSRQVHDLHTSLVLDHPDGNADQLHKCIVSDASGHGIFDGNVQVNKPAQRTDAGQLSRNLLLVPKATVNVKPNLQIIADDVVCTHGCAVSDLSDEEMFYFRARGIDADVARQALVYSFGAEIVQLFDHKKLVDRTRDVISSKLNV